MEEVLPTVELANPNDVEEAGKPEQPIASETSEVETPDIPAEEVEEPQTLEEIEASLFIPTTKEEVEQKAAMEKEIKVKKELSAKRKMEKLAHQIQDLRETVKALTPDPDALKVKEIPEMGKMIPKAWKEVVDEILGTDIDLEVHNSSAGDFLLHFYLPKYIDRRIGEEKNKEKDCSVGLIHRSSDVSDVEKWCVLIKATILKMYPLFTPKSL